MLYIIFRSRTNQFKRCFHIHSFKERSYNYRLLWQLARWAPKASRSTCFMLNEATFGLRCISFLLIVKSCFFGRGTFSLRSLCLPIPPPVRPIWEPIAPQSTWALRLYSWNIRRLDDMESLAKNAATVDNDWEDDILADASNRCVLCSPMYLLFSVFSILQFLYILFPLAIRNI